MQSAYDPDVDYVDGELQEQQGREGRRRASGRPVCLVPGAPKTAQHPIPSPNSASIYTKLAWRKLAMACSKLAPR